MNDSSNFRPAANNVPHHVAFFLDMSTQVQTNMHKNFEDVSVHVETRPDTARFTLTVEEASELFAQAGVPRSPKTVTRFCNQGHLEFTKADTEKNYKFLIDPSSVERRIKEL